MFQTGPVGEVVGIVREALEQFVVDLTAAIPKILAGVVFLTIAFALVRTATFLVGLALKRTLAGESPVYRRFVKRVVATLLWFAVALSFLSVVGLEGLAASVGTASGFIGLGVAYALSDMIEDVVSGVYLLRDPDFQPGDTVTVGDTTGVVRSIELRKTRFEVEDDTVVRANAEIEKRWTKLDDDQVVGD